MIASSPSGATVRSQSTEITPAPALPSFSLLQAGLLCVFVCVSVGGVVWTSPAGETKVTAVLSSEEGDHLILAHSSLNKWKIFIKMSSVLTTGTGNSSWGNDCPIAGRENARERLSCQAVKDPLSPCSPSNNILHRY